MYNDYWVIFFFKKKKKAQVKSSSTEPKSYKSRRVELAIMRMQGNHGYYFVCPFS